MFVTRSKSDLPPPPPDGAVISIGVFDGVHLGHQQVLADNIELAAEAGITAIVQPGGSIRDDEVIAAADKAGLAMVFTGVRHFRH